MSVAEIIIIGVALVCVALVIAFASRVLLNYHREWEECEAWWAANDAEKERRSRIDRTVWGSQIPPKEVLP